MWVEAVEQPTPKRGTPGTSAVGALELPGERKWGPREKPPRWAVRGGWQKVNGSKQ